MSFRCPRCTQAFAAPATPIRLVTAWRTRQDVAYESVPGSRVADSEKSTIMESYRPVPGTTRREIEHEETMCLSCAYRAQPDNEEVLRRMAGEEAKKRRVSVLPTT